jgi:DNA polymerase III subunit alpha
MGIGVLPPDINASLVDFTVVDEGGTEQIRFGLAAIKGVGETAVRSLLEVRERDGKFADIFDFAARVDPKFANRRVLEALVRSGAMDSLGGNRNQLLDAVDAAVDLASAHARERELGQFSLFGESSGTQTIVPKLRSLAAPSTLEMLAWERDTLGVFLSGHPLADVAEALARSGAIPVREAKTRSEEEVVTIAGLLTHVRRTLTRAQSQMLIATLEDMSGSIECVVYPKLYDELQSAFVQDRIVILSGRVRIREAPGKPAQNDAQRRLSCVRSPNRCRLAGTWPSAGATKSTRLPRFAPNSQAQYRSCFTSVLSHNASSAESPEARAFVRSSSESSGQ